MGQVLSAPLVIVGVCVRGAARAKSRNRGFPKWYTISII